MIAVNLYCDNARNRVKARPKEIPLTDTIGCLYHKTPGTGCSDGSRSSKSKFGHDKDTCDFRAASILVYQKDSPAFIEDIDEQFAQIPDNSRPESNADYSGSIV